MEQTKKSITHWRANSNYLQEPSQAKASESKQPTAVKNNAKEKPDANLQEPSQVIASESNANEERGSYTFSIEDAERYFFDAGYEVPSRTISHYCKLNNFICKKFSANGVRRWFIEKPSLDKHIEQMRYDGHAIASESKQPTAVKNNAKEKPDANLQEPSQAIASESNDDIKDRYIQTLENQLNEKDKQIAKMQTNTEDVATIAKGLGFLLRSPNREGGDNQEQPESSTGV